MKKCDCMNKFNEDVRSSNTAVWLFAFCSFLLGIVLGFLFSPVKNGIAVGSYNGSYNEFNDSNNVNRKGKKEKCCKKHK